MNKKLVTLCVLFLFSIFASAQIQRKFFNFYLARSTKTEVINYFKAKGNRVRLIDDKTVAVNDVRFGGQSWGVSHFQFYKNKLVYISFMNSEHDIDKSGLDMMWDIIDESIKSKYSLFYLNDFSKIYDKWYDDNRTRINFKYEYFQGAWALSIVYIDIHLYDLMFDDENDEF